MRTPVETWREGARSGHTHESNEVTVQLDGMGRQLSELTAQPSAPEGSDGPVFVDESGRRSKTFRRLGWVIGVACACYAATLAVALIGGSSSAPWLPLSGPEAHKNADVVQAPPAPTGGTGEQSPPGSASGRTTTAAATPGGAATPSGGSGSTAGAAARPGEDAPSSAPVVPPEAHGVTGGSKKPDPATSAPVPPVDTAAPSAGPSASPTDSTPPPAQSPEPAAHE
ncbi:MULTISPECIES: hypothetical protein [unclassified Streptomyces]|uniref:hypothetical protein n=1 Tax=unclassified Streptomyces TaxID=2593676 RepID=UPI0036E01601